MQRAKYTLDFKEEAVGLEIQRYQTSQSGWHDF